MTRGLDNDSTGIWLSEMLAVLLNIKKPGHVQESPSNYPDLGDKLLLDIISMPSLFEYYALPFSFGIKTYIIISTPGGLYR